MEYFNIYNKYGEKTSDIVERGEAHRHGITHRVIHLWLLNSHNEILIQQRSSCKDAGADLWYVSVAGHINSSDNIEQTLIRETKEELGLDITHLTESIRYLFTFKDSLVEADGSFIDNEFYDVFILKADFTTNEMNMQAEEVQAVKYITYDEFRDIVINKDKTFWHHEFGYKMLLLALNNFFNI